MEGVKYDGEKPKMHLLPPKAILEVAKVLTYGAQKYDEENWRKVPDLQTRYSSAALRHIFAHLDGEEVDEESGLDHLAHAMCCLLFKLEDQLNGEGEEESAREFDLSEYIQSDWAVGTYRAYAETDFEERSVSTPEHSVQYYPPDEDYRRV